MYEGQPLSGSALFLCLFYCKRRISSSMCISSRLCSKVKNYFSLIYD
ncbi:hypothetical protein HMPREF1992_00826 [Selenomonas sp. oral taxon 892 str. F0426]|nr:hypothetical protein HMPREF1992_00826 [Selenomonas sp. oral taxon 892 str. F0426]